MVFVPVYSVALFLTRPPNSLSPSTGSKDNFDPLQKQDTQGTVSLAANPMIPRLQGLICLHAVFPDSSMQMFNSRQR